jgi:hypothetical protein
MKLKHFFIVSLIFTSCGNPLWRDFEMVNPGLGFKRIERVTDFLGPDSMYYITANAAVFMASDSLYYRGTFFQLEALINSNDSPYDLSSVFLKCRAGDSIVIQMNKEVYNHQSFVEKLLSESDSLFRLHIRIEQVFNQEGYKELMSGREYSLIASATRGFRQMIALNRPGTSMDKVLLQTQSFKEGTGKGITAMPGDSLLIDLTICTATGQFLYHSSGGIWIESNRGLFLPSLEREILGEKVGEELTVFIPFTENQTGPLLSGMINNFDNLYVKVTLLDVRKFK